MLDNDRIFFCFYILQSFIKNFKIINLDFLEWVAPVFYLFFMSDVYKIYKYSIIAYKAPNVMKSVIKLIKNSERLTLN